MVLEFDYGSEDDSDWELIIEESSSCSSSEDNDSSFSCQDHDSNLSCEEEAATFAQSPSIKERQASTDTSKTASSRFSKTLSWKWSVVLLPLLSVCAMITSSFPIDYFEGEESIYVPGVGFSGFWFTLGRLKSIQDPSSKHFVCFSAGCLGAVTILNEFTVDEIACVAATAQQSWRSGEIDRFQVVSQFVDGLVYRNFPSQNDPLNCLGSLRYDSRNTSHVPINDPNLLSKLHILTTKKVARFGVKSIMRSPTSLNELRKMLIQSAWIPLATGNGLMHDGHMDGGFSFWEHPRCTKSVNLPLDSKLILNSLNVNMGQNEAYRLWYDGLAYGI